MITKAERAELRSVVRQQFRVLKDEVGQRQAELEAEIDAQVAEAWSDRDERLGQLRHAISVIADEANTKLRALLVDHPDRDTLQVRPFIAPDVSKFADDQARHKIRAAAVSDLAARVGAATVKLGRQEADLLRQLAVGALESDEARSFLSSIPSVSELVPAARLKELEASLGDDEGDWRG